jgi:N-acetylglucosamine-6-phosphate deacetylase
MPRRDGIFHKRLKQCPRGEGLVFPRWTCALAFGVLVHGLKTRATKKRRTSDPELYCGLRTIVSANRNFFDLQVNGHGGADFNADELTAEQLHRACEMLEADGVAEILATVITDRLDLMCWRLAKLRTLRDGDPLAARLIRGIHIEGPFLNETPGFRGAHPADAIRPASVDAIKSLLEAAGGLTRIVTLAPERDPGFAVTRMLAGQRIVVSAGHTDASLDELRGAIDAGLSMFTHLGNGCPMSLHRHDNIIQRVLSLSDRLWISFIADGVHVPFFALQNYLRVAVLERCIVVTDAMSAAGLGPGRYTLGRWDLMIGEDRVARSPDGSHLVGSAGTMPLSLRNLTGPVGLSEPEALRLTRDNPGIALGITSHGPTNFTDA